MTRPRSKSSVNLGALIVAVALLVGSLSGCGAQPDPKPRWVTTIGRSVLIDQTAAGDLILAEAEDSLYALVASTGVVRWQRHPLGTYLLGRAVVADGAVYIKGHQLFALDAASGATRWTWPWPAGVQGIGDPAVSGGLVYVTTNETNRIYVLDERSGVVRANLPILGGGLYESAPAVEAGRVFVEAPLEERVTALDAATGRPLWTRRTLGQHASDPVVAGGSLYVTADGGKVYAFDAGTGAPRWSASISTPEQGTSSPLVIGGTVYLGSDDHHVTALSATTGARLWTAEVGGRVQAPPALDHGVLYAGSDDGRLYAFDSSTGKPRGIVHPGIVGTTPVVIGGLVCVGTLDGRIYAYDTAAFR